jgi:hypothetical protein
VTALAQTLDQGGVRWVSVEIPGEKKTGVGPLFFQDIPDELSPIGKLMPGEDQGDLLTSDVAANDASLVIEEATGLHIL